MGTGFRRFITKAFLLILAFIFIDCIFGSTIHWLFNHQRSGELFKMIRILESKDEVIILGNSRANHHYIPQLFKDSLQMTVINAGADGQNIYYHMAVLNNFLKNGHPKILVLELGEMDLLKTTSEYDRDKLSLLLPFYKDHAEMRTIILSRSKLEKFKILSSFYAYNSTIIPIGMGVLGLSKVRTDDGYYPLFNKWQEPMGEAPAVSVTYDPMKLKCLEDFIQAGVSHHCKIIVAVSPMYIIKTQPSVYNKVHALFKRQQVLFLFHEHDSLFLNNRNLFNDKVHLNDEGARLYSSMVVHEIKQSFTASGK